MDQKPDKPRRRGPDEERPTSRGPGLFNPRTLMVWLLIVLAVLVTVSMMQRGMETSRKKYTIDEFFSELERQPQTRIEKVVLGEQEMRVFLKKESVGAKREESEYRVPVPDDVVRDVVRAATRHNQQLDEQRAKGVETPPAVQVSYEPPNMWVRTLLLYVAPWVLPVVLLFLLFRQMRAPGGGGVLAFGKSRARLAKKSTGITFDDVAGIEEAKEEVMEVIEFLRNPERFERLGGRVPRGVLLVGPPGTGKTLLAKAIAGEADRPFFSISGSDFVEMFVGVGASRVRDLFRQAKENSPCIIFLDEIDAVGRRRGTGLGGGHDEREQTLNAILVEMDGFETDDRVIMIAATNRPDVLDPALLRPGRFDRQVVVDLPDVKGREAILRVKARNVKLANPDDLKFIARGTSRCSGAELENIINEGAILAVLKNHDEVTMEDLEEARDKVLWGRAKKSKVVAEYERRIGAYHEAGHAVMSELLEHCDPLHKVTIIPRGVAGGMTMILPKEDTYLLPKKKLIDQITMGLGGRASEEIFCDDLTSGAQGDLEMVTETARMMVCKWGMTDDLGPVNYAEREEHLFLGREITRIKTMSEETSIQIDREIKRIVEECYQRAKAILSEKKDAVQRLVAALIKHEVLDADQVDLIIAGRPLPEKPAPASPVDAPSQPSETESKAGAAVQQKASKRARKDAPPAGEAKPRQA